MAKKTIMIVDDEPNTVDLLEEMLKPEGYKIIKAYDGKECLDKLKKTKPDLILLDFFMPDMSGREVLEKIRQDPKQKDIKVAFITVATFSPTGEKAMEGLGSLDYIKKPFHREDLIRRVKGLLR